jgi:UDP-N-acetylglucosamine diphosphorylase/glucosamine-1-phosphate N-acetyltransferase
MNIILFDAKEWENLRPLTLTKPVAELRMGILTFKERWEKLWEANYSYYTPKYLAEKYPIQIVATSLYLNPAYFPSDYLLESLQSLKEGEALFYQDEMIAFLGSYEDFLARNFQQTKTILQDIIRIEHLWDLFSQNNHAIQYDFDLVTKGRISQPISSTNGIRGENQIFLEEGAVVEYALLNALEGPIYVGKNAEIMEGSMIRGGLALCEGAKFNLGAKIYSGTTIGPYCKVGGEVNNSILMGYSNKGHDGFLGNSVLGEWCNLGADTNNSNLKNNYSEIKVWNYNAKDYISTGLQFCGLMMGDFSKSAINTQFNTGTVVGVSSNVFDPGFPPKFIPSFSWGGGKKSVIFELDKVFESAERMMERRKKTLTEKERNILTHIFQHEDY